MGNSQNKLKSANSDLSEECKREYFKWVKKDFTAGIKKINATIHSPGKNVSFCEDNWVSYLLTKFGDYLNSNKINVRYIRQILDYLNNQDSNEAKHVYNLSIYLSKEIESDRQSLIDRFYPEEEVKNNTLSKDEVLWKGSEFIFKDLEDFNHPINGFLRHLTFVLCEVYEKEYLKIISEIDKNSHERKNSYEVFNTENCYNSEKLTIPINRDILKKNYRSENLLIKHCENNLLSNSNDTTVEQFYSAMHRELLTFSNYIANAVVRFYSIKSSTSPKLFEIFFEKVKDLLIRRDLYGLIYKIKSKLNQNKKVMYAESLIQYYNIKPHYLCVSPYFSQDNTFRNIIQTVSGEVNSNTTNKKEYKTKNEKHVSCIPFMKSILKLRTLSECDSILQKIDIMYIVRNSVLNEIDEFWKGVPLLSKYKYVDADNLLTLFIYITIKSQTECLLVDLQIIDDFTNRNLKLSRKGYFYSLFQSSIEYLVGNLTANQLDLNLTEYNNMLTKEIQILESSPELIIDFENQIK